MASRGKMRGFMENNFDWDKGVMDCRFKITDLMNENLHMQGDTIVIQLAMVERADTQLAKSATFVGELRLKYKHCFEPDNVNNWQWQ